MSVNVQGLCMDYVLELFKDWKSLKTQCISSSFGIVIFLFRFVGLVFLVVFFQ